MKSRWPGASGLISRVHECSESREHTNDGDIELGSLELPEGNVDRDTTLTLGLELVKNPGILEGALAELSSLLLAFKMLAFLFEDVRCVGYVKWVGAGQSGSA